MKTSPDFIKRAAVLFFFFSTLNFQLSTCFAQDTAFTYQGRLNNADVPASGTYDLRFVLYDSLAGGSQQGPILTNTVINGSNGLFTVTLDFGNQFSGDARWLEISVRTNGNGSFNTLSPRQPLTPTPYAVTAMNALTAQNITSGGIPAGNYGSAVTFSNAANSFSGSFSGSGANLSGVNADLLDGLGKFDLWQLGGNNVGSGQFIGSVNSRPVDIRVNNLRAMRFNYASNSFYGYSPNIVGGCDENSVANGVFGATIAGGGSSSNSNSIAGRFGVIAGGHGASIGSNANACVIGGGGFNSIDADTDDSVIGGGNLNRIESGGGFSFIGGGHFNGISSNAFTCTLAGGNNNKIQPDAENCTIGGGYNNAAGGENSTIPGGSQNFASGDYSFAAGQHARAQHAGAFVWGDASQFTDFASSGNNQFLIRAAGGVGIGLTNPAAALHVASAESSPEFQITQKNSGDYTRLRMNVGANPFWEMDVSPGATPSLGFWNSTLRMSIDYNGNVSAKTFTPSSDRNLKEHFEPINVSDVLEKVAALPLTQWNFKKEITKHVGPMAQDFYAAFGVGADDKHIATVDADGVALAAIQGLNKVVRDKENEIRKLQSQNSEMEKRLSRLEQLIQQNRQAK